MNNEEKEKLLRDMLGDTTFSELSSFSVNIDGNYFREEIRKREAPNMSNRVCKSCIAITRQGDCEYCGVPENG